MKNQQLPRPPIIEKGIYRHSKTGNRYEVIGVALHSETLEPLVIYRPLYMSDAEYFTRPYDMFFETIVVAGQPLPRFEKISDAAA